MIKNEKVKVRNQGLIITITILCSLAIIFGSIYVFFGDEIFKKENNEKIEINTIPLNEWAVISKFNEKTALNENVKVRITKVTIGKEAETLLKKYVQNNRFIEYEGVSKGMQLVVVDYEIDFKEYTKNKFGDTVKVNGAVLNKYGKAVETTNSIYSNIPIRNISSNEKVDLKTNKFGSFEFQIPIDAVDIALKLGDEKGKTQLFNIYEEN